ncbi:MAG: hypothetical protein Tsb0021_02610 [Chlamydiales bacterium]
MQNKPTQLDELLFTNAAALYPEFREQLIKRGACVQKVASSDNHKELVADGLSKEPLDYVRFLLESGVDVNTVGNFQGKTPLQKAVCQGNYETVKLLCEFGANVHCINEDEENALHIEPRENKNSKLLLIQFLIRAGVDVNQKSIYGMTPFCANYSLHDISNLKLLMKAGYEIHKENSAEVFRHISRHLDLVEYLLNLGLNLNAEDERGYFPIFYVFENISTAEEQYEGQKHAIITRMFELTDFSGNATTQLDNLFFTDAAALYPEFRQKLVDMGSNVNALEKESESSPLLYATEKEVLPYMKFLLDNGANVNYRNISGDNALFFAVARGNLAAVRLLCEYQADMLAEISFGGNLLHVEFPQRENYEALVECFIQAGVDVNARNAFGFTPFIYNDSLKDVRLLKILLKSGYKIHNEDTTQLLSLVTYSVDLLAFMLELDLNLNTTNDEGYLPIVNLDHFCDWSSELEKEKKQQLLLMLLNGTDFSDNHASLNELLFTNAAAFYPEFRHKLLEIGANVDYVDNIGREYTPLMLAAYRGAEEYVRFLVENGASINRVDRNGESALYNAVQGGNIEIVKYLCDHGADMNITNSEGQNLLHTIVVNGYSSLEIAKFLIEKGVDVNAKNESGRTPFLVNSTLQNVEMLKLLIDSGYDIYQENCADLFYNTFYQFDLIEFFLELNLNFSQKSTNGDLPIYDFAIFIDRPETYVGQKQILLLKMLEMTDFA